MMQLGAYQSQGASFTVKSYTSGYLVVGGQEADSFTSEDVMAGAVAFVHVPAGGSASAQDSAGFMFVTVLGGAEQPSQWFNVQVSALEMTGAILQKVQPGDPLRAGERGAAGASAAMEGGGG